MKAQIPKTKSNITGSPGTFTSTTVVWATKELLKKMGQVYQILSPPHKAQISKK
jgi:hypothetical protein